MFKLKEWMNKVDNFMLAVTFAEAGEHETALDFIGPRPQRRKKKRDEKKAINRSENRPTLEC